MKFTKMHGTGNDYVFISCFDEQIDDKADMAIRVSNRHFGIGSDGLICVCPSETADFKMEMYNADGSMGEMCGNGIRCLGKYVYDKGLTDKKLVTVETGAGIKILQLNVEEGAVASVCVEMGSPRFRPEEIPVKAEGEHFIKRPVEAGGRICEVTALSVGNPHAVIFVEDVEQVDIHVLGPELERHSLFPQRVNTEFVQILDRENLKMRVWERGSGETLSCGTGAAASLVAAALCELSENSANVILKGGQLFVEWDREIDSLYLTGPAEMVYEGELYV